MITLVRVDTSTRQRLKDLGAKGETYDTIVVRLLDAFSREEAKDEN